MEESCEMKNVIIVDSMFNLLLSIQLRKTILKNEECDIILSSYASGLRSIYANNSLSCLFDDVFFADYTLISKKTKLQAMIDPEKMVIKLIGNKLPYYGQVFFWNPTHLLYYLLMHYNNHKHSYALHLYGDAMGAYVVDYPIENTFFRKKIVNSYFVRRFSHKLVKELDYDYYVFSPELIGFNPSHKLVEIPSITSESRVVKCFYDAYGIDYDVSEVKAQYIYLDIKHHEQFGNTGAGLVVLSGLSKKFGNDFIVKPHPRQEKDIYVDSNVPILDLQIPWELYCMQHSIDRKVIITFCSSSAFMPYVLFDSNHVTICVLTPMTFLDYFKKEFTSFVMKLRQRGKRIYLVDSIDEIDGVLNDLHQNWESEE